MFIIERVIFLNQVRRKSWCQIAVQRRGTVVNRVATQCQVASMLVCSYAGDSVNWDADLDSGDEYKSTR